MNDVVIDDREPQLLEMVASNICSKMASRSCRRRFCIFVYMHTAGGVLRAGGLYSIEHLGPSPVATWLRRASSSTQENVEARKDAVAVAARCDVAIPLMTEQKVNTAPKREPPTARIRECYASSGHTGFRTESK